MIIPFFNAGQRLRSHVEELIAALENSNTRFEIIAVSDGSTDESELSLEGLSPELVKSVTLPEHSGKGEALRIGLGMGSGRYLGFIDADGDIDPSLIEPFISLIKLYEPDIILGSKRHPMSQVQYPFLRRIYSWGYQQLIRTLFHLNVRDTQTGLKIIKREVAEAVLPKMVEKRFAFDLELFVVARHLGYTKFFEAPIRIEHQFTSSISWKAVQGILLDTLAIYYRLHFRHYYDRK